MKTPNMDEAVVQCDHGFVKIDPAGELITVLVAVDDAFDRSVAIPVERKGSTDKLAVAGLTAFVRSLGQPSITIQSDAEYAIVSLVEKVCEKLPRARSRTAPKASKGSNGQVEQKNKSIEGMARTLLASVRTLYKLNVPTSHPIVTWAIRHGAWLKDRFQLGGDGMTPYYRQNRRTYTSTLVPFAENVVWREPGPHTLKLRAKWGYGVWLGRSANSDSHIVGTRSGTLLVRSVRRLGKEGRYNVQELLAMRGTPARMSTGGAPSNQGTLIASGSRPPIPLLIGASGASRDDAVGDVAPSESKVHEKNNDIKREKDEQMKTRRRDADGHVGPQTRRERRCSGQLQ